MPERPPEEAEVEAAALICGCGLPMSKNPHPDAGSPLPGNNSGYVYECIPCLVATRNRADG